jgi:hypothetical protein
VLAVILSASGPCVLPLAVNAGEDPGDALDRALRAAEEPDAATSAVPPPSDDPLEDALRRAEEARRSPTTGTGSAPTSDLAASQFGNLNLRLIDISLDALFAAGTSTEPDESIRNLQGGGHDPHRRGFTVQNVELSFQGAVDPYVAGEAHIIFFIDAEGETRVELEEAFLTTQALPWGLQLEAGQMMTEFGRLNPRHPHEWEWLDQPVVNSRFFGPDGMRNPGFRLGWLSPLPWYSELHGGMQNANGETMASFFSSEELGEERPIAGRPVVEGKVQTFKDLVYLARWDNGLDITDELSGKAGLSAVYGPNSTGPGGFTRIYGADLVLKWRSLTHNRGWPFLIWQTEILKRDYHADTFLGEDPESPGDLLFLPTEMIRDYGLYTQLLWGLVRNWAIGLRYDLADAEGSTNAETRSDPFRDRRHRIAPLIVYQPTEFSRFRLQYNYDRAQHLERGDAHSVWFGVEFIFGAHAAHNY